MSRKKRHTKKKKSKTQYNKVINTANISNCTDITQTANFKSNSIYMRTSPVTCTLQGKGQFLLLHVLSFQRKRQLEITNFSEVAYSKIAFSEMITPPLKELILAAFYHSQNSRGATWILSALSCGSHLPVHLLGNSWVLEVFSIISLHEHTSFL